MLNWYNLVKLLSQLKDLSIPKHKFHSKIIPCTAATIYHIAHDATGNDLMKMKVKSMICWLFKLHGSWLKQKEIDTNVRR